MKTNKRYLTIVNFVVVVTVRFYKRVNVQNTFVLYQCNIWIDIEGLILVEDINYTLIVLSTELFCHECEIGSLISFHAHINKDKVPLLKMMLKVHSVLSPHRNLFLKSISVLIFEDRVLFGGLDQVFQ